MKKAIHIFFWFLVFLIVSCLTDGPNQTGGTFLRDNQIDLSQTLDSTEFFEVEVDSFWTSEYFEWGLSNNSIWGLGDLNNLKTSCRFGFRLPADSSRHQTDSLTFSFQPHRDSIIGSFFQDYWENIDSLTLEVRAFFTDSSEFRTRVNDFFTRNISREQFVTLAGEKMVRDTLVLTHFLNEEGTPKRVSFKLKNTGKIFAENPESPKQFFLDVVPLDWDENWVLFDSRDSVSFLVAEDSVVRTTPSTFGFTRPQRISRTLRLNHVTFANPTPSIPKLISPLSQQVHFSINRSLLIQLLNKQLPYPISDNDNQFNQQYYIPKATFQIPLQQDSVWTLGEIALETKLTSELDSLLLDSSTEILPDDFNFNVFLNDTSQTKHYVKNTITNKITDTISYTYIPYPKEDSSSNSFQFIISYDIDTVRTDTVLLTKGKTTRKFLAIGSSLVELWLTPDETEVTVTGALQGQETNHLSTSLFENDSTRITVPATRGMQRILSRAQSKQYLSHQFTLSLNAINSGFPNPQSTQRLGFPPVAIAPLKVSNGKLKIEMKIHYVPLESF